MNQRKQTPSTIRFSTAQVLRGSLGLFWRRAPLYLLLAAISLLIGSVFHLSGWADLTSVSHIDETFTAKGLDILSTAISSGIAGSLIVYPVIQQLRGDESAYMLRLVRGMPAVGASLLAALVSTAVFYAPFLLPVAIIPIGTSTNVVEIGLILVATTACAFFYCMLFLCVPIATVERLNIVQVLKRSNALTSGGKAVIFAAMFVLTGASAVLGVALQQTLPDAVSTDPWLEFAFFTLDTAVMSVLAAYVYYVLVIEKDGPDADRVAAHFD